MEKVLITGASGDIGRAIAYEFAKDPDIFLYLHYTDNKEAVTNLTREIGEERCAPVCFNLNDKTTIAAALKEMDVDMLINNAAVTRDKLFFWMEDDAWNEVIDANLSGVFYVTKALLPKMIAKKKGSIVNISSIASQKGNIGQVNYAASKGGLEALTRSLAKEVGRYGIRVNTVTPGIIRSKLSEKLEEKAYKEVIALGRFGEAHEVAETVYFVAKKATYINAQNINVCGGFS